MSKRTNGRTRERTAEWAGVAGASGRLALGLVAALAVAAGPVLANGPITKPVWLVVDSGPAFVHEPGFGNGWRYGGGLFFTTARWAGVEVLVERFEVPVEEGSGSVTAGGLPAGRMDMTSLVLNHHFYFISRGTIQPFATLGVGFAFIGYTPDDPTVTPEKDIVDRFALQLGGGFDLRVSKRLALTGRARYSMVKTWVEILPREEPIRNTDPSTQDQMHLYSLELTVGLKFRF